MPSMERPTVLAPGSKTPSSLYIILEYQAVVGSQGKYILGLPSYIFHGGPFHMIILLHDFIHINKNYPAFIKILSLTFKVKNI